MPRPRKTVFDRDFDEKLKAPGFAKTYVETRREIDAVDRLVQSLDAARIAEGLSKADLARHIRAKPALICRLFTKQNPNPTLATVVSLAEALGYQLTLVPLGAPRRTPTKAKATG